MKKLTLLLILATLAGCANVKFQWAASYQTDNIVADLERARQVKE